MEKKVLLVADDDGMNRLIIRKFLKDDYEVIEAEDGKKAMDLLYSKRVDALLLDIIMPEMDGLEVLQAVKREREFDHIGILVATSMKEKTEREALGLGADDIVSKPYDPVVIKKRMENILAVKEIQQNQILIANHDMEGLYNKQKLSILSQMEASVQRVVQYAEVIRENKDNHQLVDEALDNIVQETQHALAVNTEEKRG